MAGLRGRHLVLGPHLRRGKKIGWRDGVRAMFCIVAYSEVGDRLHVKRLGPAVERATLSSGASSVDSLTRTIRFSPAAIALGAHLRSAVAGRQDSAVATRTARRGRPAPAPAESRAACTRSAPRGGGGHPRTGVEAVDGDERASWPSTVTLHPLSACSSSSTRASRGRSTVIVASSGRGRCTARPVGSHGRCTPAAPHRRSRGRRSGPRRRCRAAAGPPRWWSPGWRTRRRLAPPGRVLVDGQRSVGGHRAPEAGHDRRRSPAGVDHHPAHAEAPEQTGVDGTASCERSVSSGSNGTLAVTTERWPTGRSPGRRRRSRRAMGCRTGHWCSAGGRPRGRAGRRARRK